MSPCPNCPRCNVLSKPKGVVTNAKVNGIGYCAEGFKYWTGEKEAGRWVPGREHKAENGRELSSQRVKSNGRKSQPEPSQSKSSKTPKSKPVASKDRPDNETLFAVRSPAPAPTCASAFPLSCSPKFPKTSKDKTDDCFAVRSFQDPEDAAAVKTMLMSSTKGKRLLPLQRKEMNYVAQAVAYDYMYEQSLALGLEEEKEDEEANDEEDDEEKEEEEKEEEKEEKKEEVVVDKHPDEDAKKVGLEEHDEEQVGAVREAAEQAPREAEDADKRSLHKQLQEAKALAEQEMQARLAAERQLVAALKAAAAVAGARARSFVTAAAEAEESVVSKFETTRRVLNEEQIAEQAERVHTYKAAEGLNQPQQELLERSSELQELGDSACPPLPGSVRLHGAEEQAEEEEDVVESMDTKAIEEEAAGAKKKRKRTGALRRANKKNRS